MKKAFLLLFTLCICVNANSQVLIIKFVLGECVKCDNALERLKPINTGIPTYVVFSTDYLKNKADIEQLYRFKERGYKVIFNDSISNAFTNDYTSQIAFFIGNKIAYSAEINHVGPSELAKIKAIEATQLFPPLSKHQRIQFDGYNAYYYDWSFKKLQQYKKGHFNDFQITIGDIKKMAKKNGCDPNFSIDEYDNYLRTNPDLHPSIVWFYPYGDTTFTLVQYYKVGFEKGHQRYIEAESAVGVYYNTNLVALHPIYVPSHFDTLKFATNSYLLPVQGSDDVLLSYVPDKPKPQPDTINRYVARFHLKDGCYMLDCSLPFQLPEDYGKYFGHNFIDYFASDDRYVAVTASDQIDDVLTGTSYRLPLDSIVPLGKRNFSTALQGSGMPVLNSSICHVGNLAFLYTSLNYKRYLINYDFMKQKITSGYLLGEIIPTETKNTDFQMSAKAQAIFIESDDNVYRIYPFNLLYSKVE